MAASHFPEFEEKMKKAGVPASAIQSFRDNYERLLSGETGLISEDSIEPVAELPQFEKLPERPFDPALLSQTVVIKLNGGLGTSMGLDRAKSLLPLKGTDTFLDFIAKQILHLRRTHGSSLRFRLMNSFSTSADTLNYLKKYPELGSAQDLELMQNQIPKIDAATMKPAGWPKDPELEWCPPGHGDLYPSLLGSGLLDKLLSEGVRYLFVSNSDNLGATLDWRLLDYFAQSGFSFLMEVAERTAADKKGGHLARFRKDGKLLLRESAQCPDADQDAFQDTQRHRFFNTNNLWIRLDDLKKALDEQGGFLRLPMIKNQKTVDPRDKKSPKVIQLETAMGAAIECFSKSGAVVVPRSRFAPVKTTNDLLALRSDCYQITSDYQIVLSPSRNGQPPLIDLNSDDYKLVDQLEELVKDAVPSLIQCRKLSVSGPLHFEPNTSIVGEVTLRNSSAVRRSIPAREYRDGTFEI